MKWLTFRRWVQMTVLTAIVAVMIFNSELAHSCLPWLSRFSPLMTAATRLAQRQWTPYFCGGVLIAFICLFFPRLFCGWLCPLGACIDLTDRLTLAQRRKFRMIAHWRLSVLILGILLVLAALGMETAGYFDPLTLVGNSFDLLLNGRIGTAIQTLFASGTPTADLIMPAIFLGALLGTFLGKRTWCRVLCPLGALLGLLAAVGLGGRRVSEGCIKCVKCRKICKMQAITADIETTTANLCIYCRSCSAVCPKKCIEFDG